MSLRAQCLSLFVECAVMVVSHLPSSPRTLYADRYSPREPLMRSFATEDIAVDRLFVLVKFVPLAISYYRIHGNSMKGGKVEKFMNV